MRDPQPSRYGSVSHVHQRAKPSEQVVLPLLLHSRGVDRCRDHGAFNNRQESFRSKVRCADTREYCCTLANPPVDQVDGWTTTPLKLPLLLLPLLICWVGGNVFARQFALPLTIRFALAPARPVLLIEDASSDALFHLFSGFLITTLKAACVRFTLLLLVLVLL